MAATQTTLIRDFPSALAVQLHHHRRPAEQSASGRPGGDPELIMARLEAHGLKVVSIIHTMRIWITSSRPAR